MNEGTFPTPSRLSAARARLEQAVAAMEVALADRPVADAARGEVAHALEEAEADNHALRALNDSLAEGLDAAIDRLKSILEG